MILTEADMKTWTGRTSAQTGGGQAVERKTGTGRGQGREEGKDKSRGSEKEEESPSPAMRTKMTE